MKEMQALPEYIKKQQYIILHLDHQTNERFSIIETNQSGTLAVM